MNKYLNKDPLIFLLEPTDPVIRYLALRDLCSPDIPTEILSEAYSGLMESAYVTSLLDSAAGGVLGDRNNFDTYYRGTYWKFSEAVNAGLDCSHDIIRNTAEFILERYCTDSGGFILNTNPPTEDACITGEIVRTLLLSGFRDDRIHRSVQWIIDRQRLDGGWLYSPGNSLLDIIRLILFKHPGNPAHYDSNPDRASCVYATIACADALSLYKHFDLTVHRSIKRAADYFLSHRLFVDIPDTCVSARLHSNRNQNFSIPGYPLICQYDILRGLHFLADNDYFSDRRSGDAFNRAISQQDKNGLLHFDNKGIGMLFTGKAKNTVHESKWVTLHMIRLLKKTGNYECSTAGELLL